MHHYYDGWHMGGMWLWWLLIVIAVGAVAWAIVSWARRRARPDESAEELLKSRFARGEIDRDTYEQMLADLRK